MTAPELVKSFGMHFRVVVADSPELRDEVYRIRYKVYCKEMRTEREDQFPDGRERDIFDEFADHCLLQHRSSGMYAGCVRLVYSDPVNSPSLPFETFCRDSLYPSVVEGVLPQRGSFGEISRLAVPSEFRRRKGEQGIAIPMGSDDQQERNATERRHQSPHITMGLFLAAAAMGLIKGMTGVFAMMEPRLSRYLHQFGLEFEQAGDELEYHGKRAAFYISREGLKLNGDMADLLDYIVSEIKAQLSLQSSRH
ncbi:MAG: PEP-CTERM/exosortase system-associated acyltransferase [Gammaproteobacteria bacterium]|jgi:N-acyl amino acid synthase of PEP-CTERM/exosortase system